ncbi:MAG: zinc-dependent metalloprotease [Chitinophagales bacterium]
MKHLFSALAVCVALGATAQLQHRCVYDKALNRMEQRFPGYKQRVTQAFDDAKANSHAASRAATYNVGIVFHVLYTTPQENVDDSVLFNQLKVLNEDYAHTNPDAGNVRAIFDSVADDTGIRFHIKQINRVATSATFIDGLGFPLDSVIKSSANGGDDAVDPTHYLNIWILKIEGGFLGNVLGLAYPPAGLSNWPANSAAQYLGWEGVMVDYRTVGENNPVPYPDPSGGGGNLVIRGRTMVHETGHYFGLRHIWGDGGGFTGTNNCQQSDGIDDTPFANSQSNFNCDKTRNTCSGVEAYYGINAPDMVENYMDYSEETCMNMFTRQQGALMRSVLEQQRSGLQEVAGITSFEALRLQLFPNPSAGAFTISGWKESAKVRVTSALGAGVAVQAQPTAAGMQFQLQNAASGIYFVSVTSDGTTAVQRIVVE